jgi:hypothetical protein
LTSPPAKVHVPVALKTSVEPLHVAVMLLVLEDAVALTQSISLEISLMSSLHAIASIAHSSAPTNENIQCFVDMKFSMVTPMVCFREVYHV